MDRQDGPELSLPDYLRDDYECWRYVTVDSDRLFVGLRLCQGDRTQYVPVTETPHYVFARHVLLGDRIRPVSGYADYSHYRSVLPHPCTEEQFTELIESIRRHGYDESRPIAVFRSWRRPWPLGRWDVADGFHRLAILTVLGHRRLNVVVLRRRQSIWGRILLHLRRT